MVKKVFTPTDCFKAANSLHFEIKRVGFEKGF